MCTIRMVRSISLTSPLHTIAHRHNPRANPTAAMVMDREVRIRGYRGRSRISTEPYSNVYVNDVADDGKLDRL